MWEMIMDKYTYLFNCIHTLTGIGIFCYQNNELKIIKKGVEHDPIQDTAGFCDMLMKRADKQEIPVVYQDSFQVLYICIKEEDYYFFGPISLTNMSKKELREYYQTYGIRDEGEKKIPVLMFSKVVSLAGMIVKIMLDKEYTSEELIQRNYVVDLLEKNIDQEQIIFQIQEEETEFYHHTYEEERALLICVREGKVEEALQQNMRIDLETGKMSKVETSHWRSVVTVSIAMCTRAAIEGGIPPKEAYQLSDFYLQKSDECKNMTELISLRNQAVRDLTERVRKKKENRKKSNYVERSKDYISKHYREKIYLKDMSDEMGIGSAYLSHLFSKETGIRIQDYITQFRVDKAANLLTYSDESIAFIAEYVNFPSQSYFGSVFKKNKQMTPREYREKYKVAEFVTTKSAKI
jgi:YesN/AraC family two-component response regulator